MGIPVTTLVEGTFVRIVDVSGFILQERMNIKKALSRILKQMERDANKFKRKYLNTNESWLKYLQKDPGLSIREVFVLSTQSLDHFSRDYKEQEGRIVQVYRCNNPDKDGVVKTASFCSRPFSTMLLDLTKMQLEEVEEEITSAYKDFHIGLIVRLTNFRGIKYPFDESKSEAHHNPYPNKEDISNADKIKIYQHLKDRDLEVWVVEPGERRVMVAPSEGIFNTLNDPQVFVSLEYLQIVK